MSKLFQSFLIVSIQPNCFQSGTFARVRSAFSPGCTRNPECTRNAAARRLRTALTFRLEKLNTSIDVFLHSRTAACRQTTQVSKFRTCQTSEFRIPDGDKITKSHSSEVSIHGEALYSTFPKTRSLIPPNSHYSDVPFSRKPQVPDSPGSVIAPDFYSSHNHRITDINVSLTNERQKANEHWNLVRAEYSQLIATSQMNTYVQDYLSLSLTSVIPSNFTSRR